MLETNKVLPYLNGPWFSKLPSNNDLDMRLIVDLSNSNFLHSRYLHNVAAYCDYFEAWLLNLPWLEIVSQIPLSIALWPKAFRFDYPDKPTLHTRSLRAGPAWKRKSPGKSETILARLISRTTPPLYIL